MKKMMAVLLIFALTMGTASATILPASGVHEDYEEFTTYIDAVLPGVVLCEELTILNVRGDQGGQAVSTLKYGTVVPVADGWDGYSAIYYDVDRKIGWVRSDYLLIDPA